LNFIFLESLNEMLALCGSERPLCAKNESDGRGGTSLTFVIPELRSNIRDPCREGGALLRVQTIVPRRWWSFCTYGETGPSRHGSRIFASLVRDDERERYQIYTVK
jgi:hypothetical protein